MVGNIYTPLPPISPYGRLVSWSRVVELWPGEGADPFYCNIEVVNLDNAPFPFETLSYTWGRETSDVPLLVGDRDYQIHGQLEITKNLEQALRHLRLPTQRRRLWVDAVCIN